LGNARGEIQTLAATRSGDWWCVISLESVSPRMRSEPSSNTWFLGSTSLFPNWHVVDRFRRFCMAHYYIYRPRYIII